MFGIVLSFVVSAQNKISVDFVNGHLGENVIVCSQVFGIKQTDKVTFINVGAAYSGSPLTVVIFTKDLANFKDNPSALYNDKKICVIGKLQDYKGKTEIVITQPSEIILQ